MKQTPERATYWLYHGTRVLTSVRMPVGSTAGEIRQRALDWHRRIPMPDYGYAPYEWEQLLACASIRCFAGR